MIVRSPRRLGCQQNNGTSLARPAAFPARPRDSWHRGTILDLISRATLLHRPIPNERHVVSAAALPILPETITPRQTRPRGWRWRPATWIGVDLGTANTLITVRGEGVVLNEPSVAAVGRDGRVQHIGLEAKRMLGRTPEAVRAMRPLKDGVIADFAVAEQMLREFLRLASNRRFVRVKPTVVVAVPSCITDVERRAVRDAAHGAGVKRLFMVAEPIAAAIGAGLPIEAPQGSMIVDLGGGTTDIAVIALGAIVCDTSVRTAGDELDAAIVQFMRRQYGLLIGEPTAEAIKIALGSALPLERELSQSVKGRDILTGLPRTLTVESSAVREAIAEPIGRIATAVRRALEVTPPELASDIITEGIVLTGGGALIRGLDTLLMVETGLPIRVAQEPLACVVRGMSRILENWVRYEGLLQS